MDIDFTNMLIWILIVIIIMLIGYIAYRFRAEKLPLASLSIDDFMQRITEVEKLMQKVKDQACWNCGGKEKDVVGNLYEENQIRFVCKQCKTETVWTRGKNDWSLTTRSGNFAQRLQEKVDENRKG